jgi:outer membrane biosynthesis protein TonB
MGVPRFALLETRGPDPRALLLSVVILTSLVYLSVILGRLSSVTRVPRAETVTMLVLPPEPPTLPDISMTKNFSEASTVVPQAAEPDADSLPAPELVKPQPEPSTTTPVTPELVAAKPIPPEIVERPTPIPTPPEPAVASAVPAAAPAVMEAPKLDPQPAPPASIDKAVAHDLKQALDSAAPTRVAARDVAPAGPASLGGVPLSQIIEEQDGLAAGLAALPSAERLGLPRVSIRVNAQWLEALPKTQERLYFSITTPEADREVLAYLPATHSFDLERPERPLWQIHDGDRVPALAELRAAAARWLGVSPTLVGLYTWHPPVFEDALRMFVLERMQELRVHLGPRDVVTVRLAAGSDGAVMNLEPLRAE